MDVDTVAWMVCFSGFFGFLYFSYCFIFDKEFTLDYFVYSASVGLSSLTSIAGLIYLIENCNKLTPAAIACLIAGVWFFQGRSFLWVNWLKKEPDTQ